MCRLLEKSIVVEVKMPDAPTFQRGRSASWCSE
jgi:hypothetical protein